MMPAVQAESPAKKVSLIGLVLPIFQPAAGMQALFQSVTRCIVLPSLADVMVDLVVSVVPLTH